MNLRLPSVIIAVTCLLGGCTVHGPGPEPVGGVTTPPTGGPVAVGGIPQAQRKTEIVPPPPLAEYVPYMDGPQPTAAEISELARWSSDVQDAIASCMAARGFKYVPQPFDTKGIGTSGRGTVLLVVPVPFLDPDRAVVEQNGYGLMAPPEPPVADPNVAYQQSLSPAEAAAYEMALSGDPTTQSTAGSCSAEVMDSHPYPAGYGDSLAAFSAGNGDVLRAIASEYIQGFLTEPRVATLNQQWEACMNSKGYVFDVASGDGPQVAFALALRTRPDGTVGPPNVGVPVDQIPPDENSLMGTEPERKIALADYDCRVSTDYLPSLFAIRVQMDNEFIAANGAALERLKNSQ